VTGRTFSCDTLVRCTGYFGSYSRDTMAPSLNLAKICERPARGPTLSL